MKTLKKHQILSIIATPHNITDNKKAETILMRQILICFNELKGYNPSHQIHKRLQEFEVVVYRLLSGHYRMHLHQHQLRLSPTPNCPELPYVTGLYILFLLLMSLSPAGPLYQDLRTRLRPNWPILAEKPLR